MLSGIRRRIPRAASPSINEHDLGTGQTSTVSEENSKHSSLNSRLLQMTLSVTLALDVASHVASSIQIDSLPGATPPTPILQRLQSIFELATSRFKMSMVRYKANRLLAWLVHKETASVISLCFVVISVFFMAWSAILANSQSTTSFEHSLVSDPNFLGNLSQSILSNLSIYLIIASTVHNRSVGLRDQSWFWLCLYISSLSSLLGLSLYSVIPLASILFLSLKRLV